MRFIIPTILLIISIAMLSVLFSQSATKSISLGGWSLAVPSYPQIKELQAEKTQYESALANSRKLQEERDTLGKKYNAIPPESLNRLSKFIPDSADNIRLIIDIQRIAQAYGLSLSSIRYDAGQTSAAPAPLAPAAPSAVAAASNDYGTFNLEFSVSASYENFLKFIKDLESSLRLVDIQSITFTTDTSSPIDTGRTLYTVKLSTYWLKS